MLPCTVWSVLNWIFNAYSLLLIVYALVSWIPSLRGRWTDYLGMVIEPVLTPVRRIIPPLGGLDLSFLVVFIIIRFVAGLTASEPCV